MALPSLRIHSRRSRASVAAVALTALVGTAAAALPAQAETDQRAISVQTVASGLDIPWDIGFLPGGNYLVTERLGRLRVGSINGGPLRTVTADFSDVIDEHEDGLMGLAIDPGFAANRTFYTCQSSVSGSDNRIVRWSLSPDTKTAVRVGSPVLTGMPRSSFHNGCRVLVGPDGKVWATSGDAGIGPAPQDLDNLGGKVLRVNRDGSVPVDNPWASATTNRKYVWNYGHRNIQGLAFRSGSNQVWTAEHGPDRDDEINLGRKGANYGWDPVDQNGNYFQGVPMTDLVKFPAAIPAAWSSGSPTIATSGVTFLTHASWGTMRGVLLAAQLKGSGVLIVRLDAAGNVKLTREFGALNNTYGRLRTVRQAPNGALYVLTSNGSDTDKILRVTP